jgi:hypothetical protein
MNAGFGLVFFVLFNLFAQGKAAAPAPGGALAKLQSALKAGDRALLCGPGKLCRRDAGAGCASRSFFSACYAACRNEAGFAASRCVAVAAKRLGFHREERVFKPGNVTPLEHLTAQIATAAMEEEPVQAALCAICGMREKVAAQRSQVERFRAACRAGCGPK